MLKTITNSSENLQTSVDVAKKDEIVGDGVSGGQKLKDKRIKAVKNWPKPK